MPLLQVVKNIVPPMSNEIITLVKDTSLARTIAIIEVIRVGEDYITGAGLFWPLFYTGAFFIKTKLKQNNCKTCYNKYCRNNRTEKEENDRCLGMEIGRAHV